MKNFISALIITVHCAGAALAAGFSFDGGKGAPLFSAYTLAAPAPASAPAASATAGGLRAYDFKALWKSLGYRAHEGQDGGEAVAGFGATEDEVMDLTSYTSKSDPFYQEVNGYLRFYPAPYDWSGTSPEAAAAMVKNIDRVFGRTPRIPADLAVFRGLDLKFRGGKPYAAGEEFVDKGYVSTSASYKVARYFAIEMHSNDGEEQPASPSRKAVFVMYFGRPEKGILIDQGEDEVLLGHGRKFRVMAQKQGVKKYDLYLVQVCGEACETSARPGVNAYWESLQVQD